MQKNEKLNYVEFGTRDIAATKQFFLKAFGWEFVDYGPEYTVVFTLWSSVEMNLQSGRKSVFKA